MKAQSRAIVASLVVLALAVCAVSGVTYSWWSDSEEIDIGMSAGGLDVDVGEYKVYVGDVEVTTVTTNDGLKFDIAAPTDGETYRTYTVIYTVGFKSSVDALYRIGAVLERNTSVNDNDWADAPVIKLGTEAYDGSWKSLSGSVGDEKEVSYDVSIDIEVDLSLAMYAEATLRINNEITQRGAVVAGDTFKSDENGKYDMTEGVEVYDVDGTPVGVTVSFTGLIPNTDYRFEASAISSEDVGLGPGSFVVDLTLFKDNSVVGFGTATVTLTFEEDVSAEAILHESNGTYLQVIDEDTDPKIVTFTTDSFSNFIFLKNEITIASGAALGGIVNALEKSESGITIQLLPVTYNVGDERLFINDICLIGSKDSDGNPATVITSDASDNGASCALYQPSFKNASFENILFGGCTHGIRGAYVHGDVEFINCVFEAQERGFHMDAGEINSDEVVSFDGCSFIGKNSFGYGYNAEAIKYSFDGCTFLASGGQGVNKMYGNGWFKNCSFEDGTTLSAEGKGTLNGYKKVLTINSVVDLKNLASDVNGGNNHKGVSVLLLRDLDLEKEEWTPIGNSTNKFQGTFDGCNHTISNLTITGNKSYVGLFGFTTDGEIKNLTVENADVSGRLGVGVVAGSPYTSKYTNIKVTGHVKVDGMAYVGGVGGRNAYANWTDITVDVDENSYVKANSVENGTAYRTYVGGVVGFMGEGDHVFKNITSNIEVTGSTIDVGGITGIAHYGNSFINCSSSGNVTITDATEAADAEEIGGIAGVWHNQTGQIVVFKDCSYTGKLSCNFQDVELNDNGIVGNSYSSDQFGYLVLYGVESASVKNKDVGCSDVPVVSVLSEDGLSNLFKNESSEFVLKLDGDVVLTDTFEIMAGYTVWLDLNGHAISQTKDCSASYSMISNYGSLIIFDTVGTGSISFTDAGDGDSTFGWGSYTVNNRGELRIANAILENNSTQNGSESVEHMYCTIQQGNGKTIIDGGEIRNSTYRSVRINAGELTINGGTFVGQVWIQPNQSDCELVIKGGVFSPTGMDGSSVFITNEGENHKISSVSISGGTFTTKIGCSNPTSEPLSGSITGGKFSESAKDNTASGLISDDYGFSGPIDGYYSVVMKQNL